MLKMKNKWLSHVKKTMKLYPDLPLSDVLKIAKTSYRRENGR